MITGSNITKIYGQQVLFQNINFKLGNHKKIALVGKNGCGKSTLLKLIAGKEELDNGSITVETEQIAYIPQELDFPNDQQLVGEFLEGLLENPWDFYKIEALAAELEFSNFDIYQHIASLSEGQKMKLKIIEALLLNPTTLLIDEPTNHLDIEGVLWFEAYLKTLKKTVLMISHDREFLNATADEIWEIDNRTMYKFVGNYDTYREQKLKLINRWDVEYQLFVKKKAQLEKLLALSRVKRLSRKGGSDAIKTRIKKEIEENTKEKYVDAKIAKVNFETGISHSKLMVRFDHVTKAFAQTPVFKDLSFEIRGGEKIWLYGQNGEGKSTIVKLIVGLEQPTLGEVILGPNIKLGYFAQKQAGYQIDKTLLDYFIFETSCYFGEVFAKLKRFMFEKDDLIKPVKTLSPGQRARFEFAIFASKNYDMLILDEPDNHLDINTKEVLEESLAEYKGTLLLISHDRYFVERVGVTKILNLRAGVLT